MRPVSRARCPPCLARLTAWSAPHPRAAHISVVQQHEHAFYRLRHAMVTAANNRLLLSDSLSQTTSSCLHVSEGLTALPTCSSGVISAIEFASYGTPNGGCDPGYQANSSCHAEGALSIVAAACLGQTSCTILADNSVFGDPCIGVEKALAISILCSIEQPPCIIIPATGSFSIQLSQSVVGAEV